MLEIMVRTSLVVKLWTGVVGSGSGSGSGSESGSGEVPVALATRDASQSSSGVAVVSVCWSNMMYSSQEQSWRRSEAVGGGGTMAGVSTSGMDTWKPHLLKHFLDGGGSNLLPGSTQPHHSIQDVDLRS